MSLAYQFKKANRIIQSLDWAERTTLNRICSDIREAEIDLGNAAEQLMTACHTGCKGICCRNIDLDAIIGLSDFVYILAIRPDLAEQMADCLEKESRLFTADCIFLENGTGPCIFPEDVRPQTCLITFCDEDAPIGRHIARVKRAFFGLSCFVSLRWLRRLMRHVGYPGRDPNPDRF